jgi:soluble lytic murein transglycosylase-like protein
MKTISRITALVLFAALSACATDPKPETGARQTVGLYPNETPELRALINEYAKVHDVPPSLIHRVIQRESDYRPNARNGPYYGMMQILPATARTMGFRGSPSELLDPEVTLRYAGRYLRGAWLVSDGNEQKAVMWYARGYYYEARDRCMLRVTRLADRERC